MGVMTQENSSNYKQPPTYLPNAQHAHCLVYHSQATYHTQALLQNYQNNAPYANHKRKPPRIFTSLAESLTHLY